MAQPAKSRVGKLFAEAKRRRVYTTAGGYLAVAIVLITVGPPIFKALRFPDVANDILTVLLLLGFPAVLILAWIFDIGPSGVHRTDDVPPGGIDNPFSSSGASWSESDLDVERDAQPLAPIAREAPDPMRVQRAALAFIRHELRTPINAIIGYSEMLTEDARDDGDDTAAQDLARITSGGRQLLQLVEEILNADRVNREQRDVDSYGAQIRAELRDPLSAVIGYTEMLIETAHEKNTAQHTTDLERILSAARKLLDTSSDIARLAMRAPETGQQFSQKATLTEEVLSKIRAVDGGSHEEDRQGSLLIVDDSPVNRDLLARQLARRGYLVATADNGHLALQRMAEQQFDVVLLDVVMPELDGIEVLRRMQDDRTLRDIPVIMISALDEIDSVIRCLEIGAADFLNKPFHPTLLDVRIAACLATRRTRERERALRTQLAARVAGNSARAAIHGAPQSVMQRIEAGEKNVCDAVQHGAVLWCEIERSISAGADPARRAALLHRIVDAATIAARDAGCEMLAMHTGIAIFAGFPASAGDACQRVARCALALQRAVRDPQIRMGLHVGAVAGAAVGTDGTTYWVWGDAIDLARRLANVAGAGATFLSPAAHAALKDTFPATKHSVIEVHGRGEMRPFVLQDIAKVTVGTGHPLP